MKKRIAVLGSTGSIGTNTLDVISSLKDEFKIVGLSADSNIALLAQQVKRFFPKVVSVGSEDLAKKIKGIISSKKTEIVFGPDGLREIVSMDEIDIVVFAISGTGCLVPLMDAIRKKKQIALANKEALVSAGCIVMDAAKKNAAKIIPIDSEHSAVFQCIEGKRKFLSKVYLTGSGGPLLNVNKSKFDSLTKRFILNHPKWKMGEKISVDSATMMNKGLEVIEAKYLFDIDEDSVEVLIHPEAVIHSMVELVDGTVFAQLGLTDMRIPIQYALTYPDRVEGPSGMVDFYKADKLTFSSPDYDKFPCLGIARQAAKSGIPYPAILCAADEEVVKNYLSGRIKFSDIPKIIEKVLSRYKNVKKVSTVNDILEIDSWAKNEARSICYH